MQGAGFERWHAQCDSELAALSGEVAGLDFSLTSLEALEPVLAATVRGGAPGGLRETIQANLPH